MTCKLESLFHVVEGRQRRRETQWVRHSLRESSLKPLTMIGKFKGVAICGKRSSGAIGYIHHLILASSIDSEKVVTEAG